jgi:uncharacterized protein YjdB
MARSIWLIALVIGVLGIAGALGACGDNQGVPGPSSIALSPAALQLRVGETGRVTARYQAPDGTASAGADLTTDDVTWASSDPARARVSQDGASTSITALAPGEVTITAEGRGLSAAVAVSISPALLVAVAVLPTQATVAAGGTLQLTATGSYSDGTKADVTAAALWSSASEGTATVFQGLVRGRAAGIAAITARINGKTATAQVTVAGAALQSITIAPAAPDVALGADHPFTAMGLFSNLSTADLTDQVTWSSSSPAVATISNAAGSRGLADAVGTGQTTITASLGAVSDQTQMTVSLAPVGAWIPEPGVTVGQVCDDGVKLSMASDLVYVCTAAGGLLRGTVSGTQVTWGGAVSGITNPQGTALAAHPAAVSTLMYMGAPQAGQPNWFRSQDGGATFTPFTLLDSAGAPRYLASGRFQSGIGNLVGTWDPNGGAPQAVILTGSNPPTSARVLPGASGVVRAIVGNGATNLYASVSGATPAGAAAIGGVFRSVNNAMTWTAQDAGIAAADRNRITALVMDPVTPAILYAAVDGGARVYKTTDGGAAWTASAAGLPTKARVGQLLVSPQSPSTLYAATQIGLYRSTDGGASWTLAGFQGRRIRAVAQSGAAAALVLVAADDAVGLYRAP